MSTSIPAYRSNSASPPSSSRKAAKASMSASAPSSRPPTRAPADPFYGHEETSLLSARFITSLFQCPNIPTSTAPGAPTPALAHFVAYALHRTRLPSTVTFAALMLLQRLKARFPAARGSSGHRLFISAFMIASKIICDDTYSNQSWSVVAQKMFALKEINQMEREMCSYLEWNLNVMGDEVLDFEARVRSEHGSRHNSTSDGLIFKEPQFYPTPETTPDPQLRQIRPVPSPYKAKLVYQPLSAVALPSPPASPHYQSCHSPQPPHFASNNSSLASSPASDDCKTPSPIVQTSTGSSSRGQPTKSIDAIHHSFDGRQRNLSANMALTNYPVTVNGW